MSTFRPSVIPGVGSPLMSMNIWLSVTVSSGRTR